MIRYIAAALLVALSTPASAQQAKAPTDLESCLNLLNGLTPRVQASKLDEKNMAVISPKGEAMAKQCMAKDFTGAFKSYGEITTVLDSPKAK